MFRDNERFFFALAPEGTRARREYWKTGFYRIAKAAQVPVYLGVIDYSRKRVGIADRLDLSDDVEADLRKCAEFYKDVIGRHPQNATPVRFEP